ncbi:uncharacterized protein N7503_005496 [Penicillium pulvis]|uniref:uncharacterized protein n=1 Tax=Penicillium pulvis TaxID=1562058 RepID=UPI002548E4CB|nr:uncharacterized protein N7503_005496 [Penicillium pulvis]KAJ5803046.1 hypothetical protein N7503_005496 [Penicillium pulvis]
MSTEHLSQVLDRLSLNMTGSDCLRFTPHEEESWLEDKFSQVPQYLYRVSVHNKSDGETTKIWAKSKDAKKANPGREINILDGDRTEMADMLSRHLWWEGGSPSNLLSWTSSLLFALQYVFYRHHRDHVALEDITLFIVNTTTFQRGAFVQDLDLISIFSRFSYSLRSMERLRTERTGDFSKRFYFGEYLSQGALKIEGKCSSATGKEIIDKGLFFLRPELNDSWKHDLGWANRVLKLRKCFAHEPGHESKEDLELQVALAFGIGSLFGSDWEPPIAASLLGLRRRSARDVDAICKASIKLAAGKTETPAIIFIVMTFLGWDIIYFRSNADLRALPEVQQFETIMLALVGPFHIRYMLGEATTVYYLPSR